MEEKLKNLKENLSSVANQILDKKDNNELAEKIIPTPKNPANEEILLILKYYQEGNNLDKMLPIVTGNENVSLRVLDWFVTNYSKKNWNYN